MKNLKLLLGLCASVLLIQGCSGIQQRMPIYVLPYYNSDPFMIQFTPYAAELASDSRSEIKEFVQMVTENPDDYDLITLAILPVRLYDLGMKDEASYWFYTFAFRRNVFRDMIVNDNFSTFEYIQALDNFKELSGRWINGYSFGDIDKLVATLEKVIDDNRDMRNPSYLYTDSEFLPDEKMEAAIRVQIDGVRGLIEWTLENREEITKKRKENGVEGK